uniref:Uncharacterized protein n=1 Tax=Ascaris lumbricoides TaxID=6252 RepID=A0A0M3HN47_ASCLU
MNKQGSAYGKECQQKANRRKTKALQSYLQNAQSCKEEKDGKESGPQSSVRKGHRKVVDHAHPLPLKIINDSNEVYESRKECCIRQTLITVRSQITKTERPPASHLFHLNGFPKRKRKRVENCYPYCP